MHAMSHSVALVVLALVACAAEPICKDETEVECLYNQYKIIGVQHADVWNHHDSPIYSCYQCNLTKITTRTFDVEKWHTELKEIYIQDTQVLDYETGAFAKLKGLETLILITVGLDGLDGDVGIGMENLKSLQITDNNISHINRTDFKHLVNLERLILAYNHIRVIDNNAFSYSNKLITVNLAFNLITTIHSSMFHNLHHLKNLFIEYNPIFYIDFAAMLKTLPPTIDYFLFSSIPCETIKHKMQSHLINRLRVKTIFKFLGMTNRYDMLELKLRDKHVGIAVKSPFKLPAMSVWWAGEVEQVPCFYSYPEHHYNYHFHVEGHRKRGQDASVLVDATHNVKQVVQDISHYIEFVKDKKTAMNEKLLHDVIGDLDRAEKILKSAEHSSE